MKLPIWSWSIIALFIVGGGVHYLTLNTLEQMTGQMIMTGFNGHKVHKNSDDFLEISEQISRGDIGGVILFDKNISNTKRLRKMTKHLSSIAPQKLLIAIDQEGGAVQRLKPDHGFVPTPSAKFLGQTDSENTYSVAYDLGTRLMDLGINVNFAPVIDVDINPESPAIGAHGRSFSSDPHTVTQHGGAFARGLSDAGMAYSLKHFPGHGSARADSHIGLTDVTETYHDDEMIPWRELITDATPTTMVMVAHIVNKNIDDVPASLSKKHIQMLRDMGFDGVIVSDDMDMGAIVKEYGMRDAIKMAINAGNDILVFGNNLRFNPKRGREVNAIIVDLVRSGEIPESRIRESYRRIMRLKQNIGRKIKRSENDDK